MKKNFVEEKKVWVVTPFEKPDALLMRYAAKAGAFPILHLGHNLDLAKASLEELATKIDDFGVCFADTVPLKVVLPNQVSKIVVPWGIKLPPEITKATKHAEIVWQVKSIEEAEAALTTKVKTLILKGCESAGLCGESSVFIMFQKLAGLCTKAGVALFVQGGVGVHTASAYMALGATGVVLDSQVALLPECSLAPEYKAILGRLSGNELRDCEGYKYYIPLGSATGNLADLKTLYAQLSSLENDIFPLGQDIVLASDLADEYKKLKNVVRAIVRALPSHVKQARISDAFAQDGRASEALGTTYPIIQGPMARISDTPDFLNSVAEGGALPCLAMSDMIGDVAKDVLSRTAKIMDGKPWCAGIMGFLPAQILTEQTKLILETKPSHLLIAGGRPGQEKVFEQAGIKVLMHAPTPGLFDTFSKEGISTFVFEGRESGGHVGPLHSTVLWETQINRILKSENLSDFEIFFAGGVHDALSAAFVRIMASPLTSRGVKVGLQCGTAYLYTKEAVKFNAISDVYQKLLIEKNKTYILKSGAGQETRCVSSPFAEFFLQEKAQMEKDGLPSEEIVQRLEMLNLGRLRIATKGLKIHGDKFVPVSSKEQIEQGLYMTGTVTELASKVSSIKDVHERIVSGSFKALSEITLPKQQKAPSELTDIAIIGMSGIFPEAENLEEFWRNIIFGRDCITEVPKERWSTDIFFDPDTKDTDRVISKWGGFIGKSDFDALEFGITPQSLASIEPVQLLSLLVAKRALEDAGFTDLANADLDETAVIFGTEGAGQLTKDYNTRMMIMELLGEMPKEVGEILPHLTEDSFPGILSNVISGRISNRLNTGGRNYTVDAACASSLAALDIAIAELRTNKANMVILGGADLHNGISDYLVFGSTYALSPNGRCSTFDANADGIAISEGIAAIILKRLEDAERDGDNIYAVIKGVGGASDGKSLGLTAPSRNGQVVTLERAYESAGLDPTEVGLIESHGTGTAAGDRAELQALTHVFLENGAKPGHVALGSLKSVIGHTKCTAGLAGLIKAVFCVRHGVLPPTLNLKEPNKIFGPGSPFVFRTEKAGYWHENRRIAGISGFGFGGTNFHAIVQNYIENRPETTLKSWPCELFVFPGNSEEEAFSLMNNVSELLTVNNKLRLVDIAYSLAKKCDGKPVQYAIVAETRDELLSLMDMARNNVESENIHKLKQVDGKVAFLFSGQGSQRVNMAADLFITFPRMRSLLNEFPSYEKILFPPSAFTDNEKNAQLAAVTDTLNAQPLLGIVDLAVAELLKDFGIKPDMVAGHSYGELPALCFAGVISPNDLVPLSRARAEAILSSAKEDTGRMAAVFTDEESLSALLEGRKDVWAVNFNSPRQTVVGATKHGMTAFLEAAETAKIPCTELNVACAFHSPLLKGADKKFADAMKKLKFGTPNFTVMSNTDADCYPTGAEEIKKRLAEHVVSPVLFAEEIKNMNKNGATVFIEAGPGGALTKLASEILKGEEIAIIQIEQPKANGLTVLLHGLAKYLATGRMINIEKLFSGRDAVALNIDEPSSHKKAGIVFNIDGRAAILETSEPQEDKKTALAAYFRSALSENQFGMTIASGVSSEQVVMSYLDNMNAMMQDHRDIMLKYLGDTDTMPRSAAVRRQSVMETTAIAQEEITEEMQTGNDLPSIQSLTTEQITDMIFEIVSEKTGYPTSMLSLDTDLEADLSIDSIKKMEIVGGLRNRVQMPDNEDGMEVYFEKIIAVKKFRDLTEWVEELGRASDSGSSDDASETEQKATSQTLTSEITRVAYSREVHPLGLKSEAILAEKNFVIIDDENGLSSAVSEKLTALGAHVHIIKMAAVFDSNTTNGASYTNDASPATVVSTADNSALANCDGLLLINSLANSETRHKVVDLFNVLKFVDMSKLQWLFVFDDALTASLTHETLDTDLVADDALNNAMILDGFSGFLRTLDREYPGKHFSVVLSETLFSKDSFGTIVCDELSAEKSQVEVIYENDKRFFMRPIVTPITIDKAANGSNSGDLNAILNHDSVIVVLGGAQGISPYILEQMAKDFNCHYILVGRSPIEPEYDEFAKFDTINEIRKVLIERGEITQPREIEAAAKRIFKSSRISAAIARIANAGGKAVYKNVDVTDVSAFAKLLAEIKNEYGKIDGLFHAAGVLEDKLVRDKEYDSFMRVYDTKTVPLSVIIDELLPDLKFLMLFSSIASALGNVGQCDYATGNSVLDHAARALKKRHPELKVSAINWAPWKGAGMVSDGLEAEFLKNGIALIELHHGCKFFVDELIHGNEVNVVAMGGNEDAIIRLLESPQ